MGSTIDKLQRLHRSVQHLESALQEVWSVVDELGEDEEFKLLNNQAKSKKPDMDVGQLKGILEEFHSSLEEIPEDGTAAVDLEDAISELLDWLNNK
jgi:2-hydroxy-3-keto-5-methylthiopentenyl-1-phosphate phosphatase